MANALEDILQRGEHSQPIPPASFKLNDEDIINWDDEEDTHSDGLPLSRPQTKTSDFIQPDASQYEDEEDFEGGNA